MKSNKRISKLLAKLTLSSLAISSVGCVQVFSMEGSNSYKSKLDDILSELNEHDQFLFT